MDVSSNSEILPFASQPEVEGVTTTPRTPFYRTRTFYDTTRAVSAVAMMALTMMAFIIFTSVVSHNPSNYRLHEWFTLGTSAVATTSGYFAIPNRPLVLPDIAGRVISTVTGRTNDMRSRIWNPRNFFIGTPLRVLGLVVVTFNDRIADGGINPAEGSGDICMEEPVPQNFVIRYYPAMAGYVLISVLANSFIGDERRHIRLCDLSETDQARVITDMRDAHVAANHLRQRRSLWKGLEVDDGAQWDIEPTPGAMDEEISNRSFHDEGHSERDLGSVTEEWGSLPSAPLAYAEEEPSVTSPVDLQAQAELWLNDHPLEKVRRLTLFPTRHHTWPQYLGALSWTLFTQAALVAGGTTLWATRNEDEFGAIGKILVPFGAAGVIAAILLPPTLFGVSRIPPLPRAITRFWDSHTALRLTAAGTAVIALPVLGTIDHPLALPALGLALKFEELLLRHSFQDIQRFLSHSRANPLHLTVAGIFMAYQLSWGIWGLLGSNQPDVVQVAWGCEMVGMVGGFLITMGYARLFATQRPTSLISHELIFMTQIFTSWLFILALASRTQTGELGSAGGNLASWSQRLGLGGFYYGLMAEFATNGIAHVPTGTAPSLVATWDFIDILQQQLHPGNCSIPQ